VVPRALAPDACLTVGSVLVVAARESGAADLGDDLVEIPERFDDALPGCLGGQVDRGLQAEPDVE
jgi:hypothetical protein